MADLEVPSVTFLTSLYSQMTLNNKTKYCCNAPSCAVILTGCPWYHCGLNFSSLLRVKDAFLLRSYILLSIIPWDSGYSPCNWEDTLLQCYDPSGYTNMFVRQTRSGNNLYVTLLQAQDYTCTSNCKFNSITCYCYQNLPYDF